LSSHDSRKGRDDEDGSRNRNSTARRESATGRAGRAAERDETGSGDPGEVDEDERDRREINEIRRRIEERKFSKEKKAGRIEVAKLDVPSKVVAASTSTKEIRIEGRKEKDKDRNIEDKVPAGRRASKKATTSATTASAADAAQREEAISWASSTVSETSVVKTSGGEKKVVRPRAQPGVGGSYTDSAGERAVQDFIASQYPPIEETVSPAIQMGRALVSGALGMRLDDPRYFETAVKLPECTVVLQSTRKKARTPVSAPPPYSIESERDLNESGDLQLSQSTTDMGVFVELPGTIVESANASVKEPKIVDEPSIMIITDATITPDVKTELGVQPSKESQPSVAESQSCVSETQSVVVTARKELLGEEIMIVGETEQLGDTERRRILTEIEKSKLLRDELVRQDPSLASAASLLSAVCGRPTEENIDEKRDGERIKAVDPKSAPILEMIQPRTDTKYVERQRLTRITAAKSLLEEELKKKRPSLESVAVFRAAAYGDASTTDLTTGKDTTVMTDDASTRITGSRMDKPQGTLNPATTSTSVVELEKVKSTETTIGNVDDSEVILSDDAAMSVGDSDDDEEESDGFSKSGNSSSRGESIPSRGSRKGRPTSRLNARSPRRIRKDSLG